MKKLSFIKILSLVLSAAMLLSIFAGCSAVNGQFPFEKTLQEYARTLASGNSDGVKEYVTDECYAAADYQADTGIFSGLKYVKTEQAKLNNDIITAQVTFSNGAEMTVPFELKKVDGKWLVSDDSALRAKLTGGSTAETETTTCEDEGVTGTPEIKWDFETEGANLFDNEAAFALTISGAEKKLPFALSELSGFVIAEDYLNYDVQAKYFYNVPFTVDGKDGGVLIVYNKTDSTAKLRDCLIGGVIIESGNASNIMLPENIGLGSTVEEVQNAFGPPSGLECSENGAECTYVYKKADNQELRLTFADGVTMSRFEMKFFVM